MGKFQEQDKDIQEVMTFLLTTSEELLVHLFNILNKVDTTSLFFICIYFMIVLIFRAQKFEYMLTTCGKIFAVMFIFNQIIYFYLCDSIFTRSI